MKEFIVKKANNMPIHAPLFVDPHVPSVTEGMRNLFAVCQGEEKQIRKFLDPTPFEYVNDIFIVDISDFSNRVYLSSPNEKWPFMDCGVVVPVRYKEIFGGYYLFEYEDHDYSIAAGRELWGYPKKYAEINLTESKEIIKGTVIRSGKTIVEIECNLSKPIRNVPKVNIYPHLNIHVIPNPDGPGIFSMRIISRNPSPDFKLISEKFGETKVHLDGLPTDPLSEIGLKKVFGGGLVVGDYLITEENGWGKVLETII